MKVEEYGIGNTKTIVMLHGAHFVHSFGRQYPLAGKYHIIVPHIMGFGEHTDKNFETDECIRELADYIRTLDRKVMLVGFSLGAQLAFRLVSEYEELFEAAIIVSPWLIKEEPFLSKIAGAKEPKEVTDGVRIMAERNPNCRCEIWAKAGHNIPPFFAKQFNELICSMM